VTPEKTLRFVMVINDSLKIAMGGTSGRAGLAPAAESLRPRDRGAQPEEHRHVVRARRQIAFGGDAYAAQGFDFSGAKAFDQRMNYRTISVLCVPLKDTEEQVIGVLQLINAQDPETKRVIPFDEHLGQMMGLLGLLAAAALKSYLKVKKLTEELRNCGFKLTK
jgi:hypothetical protein